MNETVPITEHTKESTDKRYNLRGWVVLGVVVAVIATALGAHAQSCRSIAVKGDNEARTITLEEGMGVSEIAEHLKQNEIIRSTFGFQYCAWRKRAGGGLQASTYNLRPGDRVQEIIAILQGGEDQGDAVKVTAIEGWTLAELADEIEKKGLSTVERFTLATQKASNYQDDYAFLKSTPDDATLEGYLFPDTYLYDPETVDDRVVIEKMLDNFDTKVTRELRDEIASQGRTIHDVIVLASIVEREASNSEEASKIAGVFMNRLNIDMKLQSDATVNYITGKRNPRASATDIKIDSPYNTYVYKGLPPGPISNPGITAIKAAIFPEEHDYLFFLNEQEEGKAIFAETLDEHNANKQKYLE